MPAPSHFSKNGSKKSSTNRVAQNQHVLDARLALARIYQWQRLQREEALRSRPEPHQYTPRYVRIWFRSYRKLSDSRSTQ